MSQACLPGFVRPDAGREFVESKLRSDIRIERTLLLVHSNASTPTRDEKGGLYRNRGNYLVTQEKQVAEAGSQEHLNGSGHDMAGGWQ